MEHRCCENCEYGEDLKGSNYVTCHRFPPNGSPTLTGFPTSPKSSWCGEFLNKVYTEGWVQLGLFD